MFYNIFKTLLPNEYSATMVCLRCLGEINTFRYFVTINIVHLDEYFRQKNACPCV